MATDHAHDLAGAILDGSQIDWESAASSVDPADRALFDRLRVLAAIVDVHRAPTPSAPTASDAPTDRGSLGQWAHLTLLEIIGRGAFGTVYRAWDARLDREVALKLLPAPASGRVRAGTTIIEEGRALARVRHPNVVTLYGAEVIDGRVGLWMELVRGRTLQELVSSGKRWSAREAAAIGAQLGSAVAAVHAAGIVHRDIKAANVMLQDDGRVVLMDFGTGSLAPSAATTEHPRDLAGTPLYLAPELYAGAGASVATDVYSLGVLLHYLLTGSFPVRAQNASGVRLAHQRGDRTTLAQARPDLPARLARTIDRATDPDPARRPASAEAMAEDLDAIARPRFGPVLRAIAAALAVLGLGVAAWELHGRLTEDHSRSRRLLAGIGDRLAVAARGDSVQRIPAIVVLPFEDLDGASASGQFVDGVTEEILRDLARVDGLAVRSRHSSFAFRDRTRDLRTIGRQLGVDFAVTGSVQRSGDQVRLTAQLVDVANDRPLWSERFDRSIASSGELFAVIDEIALGIVNELRLSIGTGRRRYDVDLDIYEKYLEARALVERRGAFGPRDAIPILDQIVARDPAFAPAHAARADAYGYLLMSPYQSGLGFTATVDQMRVAATRAIELDPLLSEGHAAMGMVHALDCDWKPAEQSFTRALELDSTQSPVYGSYSLWVLRPLGRFVEAERLLLGALANDPLSLTIERELAFVHMSLGRYAEAIERFERVLAVDPAFPYTDKLLGRALILSGRLEEGLAVLESTPEHGLGGGHNADSQAYALVRLGRRAEAEQIAVEHDRFPQRAVLIYTALGDHDRAFEALDRAVAKEPQRVPIMLTYPELAPLQADPRMAAVRRRFKLP
jgi:serine/threonine-protein kinase